MTPIIMDDLRAIMMDAEVHLTETAWLASRHERAPSTDLVALLGLSPHRGPWEVWEEHHGTPPEPSPALRAVWRTGHELEPAICGHVGGVQCSVVAGGIVTLPHASLPVQASPDGIAIHEHLGPVGVEAKTDRGASTMPGDYARFRWGLDQVISRYDPNETPAIVRRDYLAQVYITMACCAAPAWWLVVLGAGFTWHQYLILRDEHTQDSLLSAALPLWERYVVQGEQPDPDESDACKRAALSAPGWEHRQERTATPDEARLGREYAEHRAAARHHKYGAERAKNALLHLVAGPHRLEVPPQLNSGRWGRITISTKGRISATRLTEE